MANCFILFLLIGILSPLISGSKNSCSTNSDCLSLSSSLCLQNQCIPCQETNHCTHISPNAQCIISSLSYCEISCLTDSDCHSTGGYCVSGGCQHCIVDDDCDHDLSCMTLGAQRKCGNCLNDDDCSNGRSCFDNQCTFASEEIMKSEMREQHALRNLQITAAVYTDSKYTTISIIMIGIYCFFVILGGSIMMYCNDDSSFIFRQFCLIQGLVSILFMNVNYGTNVGFTTLLSVLNVASSFTFLPNLFSLFLDYDFTGFTSYANFNIYGMTGLFLRDLGGLLWGILFAAILQGISILSKHSAPPFSKCFDLFGLKTAAKLMLFGAFQIMQVSMLQLVNATFEGGVQIVSWILGILFFLGYFCVICYLLYIEYTIYPITSAPFKASKREKMEFIYGDLRPDVPEKIRPILLALVAKNFFMGFLLVVTYEIEYLQIVFQLVLGLCYTALIAYYKPFRNNLIFGIEIVGEVGTALARLLVLIFEATGSSTIIGGMDLIIWVLLAVGFVYSIYQPTRVLIRRYMSKGDASLNNPSQMLNTIKNNQVTPARKTDPNKKPANGESTDIGINDSSLYTEQPSGLGRGISPTNKGKPGDKLDVQNLDTYKKQNSILDKDAMARIEPNQISSQIPNPILRQSTIRESTDKSAGFKKPEDKSGSNLASPKMSTTPANKLYSRQPTNAASNGEAALRESTQNEGIPPLSKRDININSNLNSLTTPQNGISESKPEGDHRFSFQKQHTFNAPVPITEESPPVEYPIKVGINQFLQDPKLRLENAKKSFPSLEKPQKSQSILERPSPNASTDNSNTGFRQPEVSAFNNKLNNNYNEFSNLDDSQNRSFNDSVSIPLNRNKNDKFININDLPNEPILPKYFNNENQNNPINEKMPPPDRSPLNQNKGIALERKPYPPEPTNAENGFTKPLVSQSQNYNRDILGREMKPPEKVNISDLIQNLRNKQIQNRNQSPDGNSGDVINTTNYKNSSNSDTYGYDRYAPKPSNKAQNTEEFSTLDPQKYLDPRQSLNDAYSQGPSRGRQMNPREDPYGANQTPSSSRPNPFNYSRKESSYSDLEPKFIPNKVNSVHDSRHMSHVDPYDNTDPYKIDPYKINPAQYNNPYSSQTDNFRSQSQPQNMRKPPPSNSDSEYELIQKPIGYNLQREDSDNYIQQPNFRNPQSNASNPGRLRNIQDEYHNPTLGQDRYSSVPADRRQNDPYTYGDRMIVSNYRNSSPDDLERSSEDMSSVNMRLYANANARGELSPQARQHEKARLQNALKNLDDIKAWINAKNQVRTPTSDSKRNTYGEFKSSNNPYN